MGVASCRSTFLCLMLRVRLVPFRISIRDLIPFSGRACCGFRSAKWLGPTQPSSARPCAPLAPTPPMRPLLSLSHLDFPRSNLPLPLPTLSPWCPRDWRQRSPEFGPRGELPSPPLLLSLSLPLPPLLPPARALSFPCSRAPLPSPLAGGAAPPPPPPCLRWRAAAPPPPCLRWRAAAPPPPCPWRRAAAPALPSPRRRAAPAPCSPGAALGAASGPRLGPGGSAPA
jgi:hypothetical protein